MTTPRDGGGPRPRLRAVPAADGAAVPPRTRDRMTVEAARLFAERGYHGTSVNDLASALGIHKSSVYAHIRGKQELLAEIALSGARAFHAALDDIPADAAPDERLRFALRAHLCVVASQLDVATVWLQEWRYLTGDARDSFVRERRRYEQRVRRLFRDAVATTFWRLLHEGMAARDA